MVHLAYRLWWLAGIRSIWYSPGLLDTGPPRSARYGGRPDHSIQGRADVLRWRQVSVLPPWPSAMAKALGRQVPDQLIPGEAAWTTVARAPLALHGAPLAHPPRATVREYEVRPVRAAAGGQDIWGGQGGDQRRHGGVAAQARCPVAAHRHRHGHVTHEEARCTTAADQGGSGPPRSSPAGGASPEQGWAGGSNEWSASGVPPQFEPRKWSSPSLEPPHLRPRSPPTPQHLRSTVFFVSNSSKSSLSQLRRLPHLL
jgi:hypothetical protein